MTLSRLIGSLTGREASARSGAPQGARPSSTSSTAGAEALLESSTLLFVPAKDTEHALGGQREVRDRIAEILPGVAFDEQGRGAFVRTGYAVEFQTGTDDYVHAIGVQVTGGRAAMPPLARVISKTGWRLVTQTP